MRTTLQAGADAPAWQQRLIHCLGPDLRQCIAWIHDGTQEGWLVVRGVLVRFNAAPELITGAWLLYQELTAQRFGDPAESVPAPALDPPYTQEDRA